LDKVAFVEHQPAPAPGQCMGVIDIGSNTCRLVVARVLPGLSFEIIDEERQSLRLAPPRPGDPIPEETLTRAEAAMRAFRQVAASHQCASVWPLATSGVREAANGEEARQRLAAALGAEVITVSSDEEGRLALNAALRSTALRDGALLDVGGGSLQVVYVRNGDHLRTVSHPDGALRLTRRLLRSDPPSKSERDKLASLLKRDLKELEPLHGGEPLYVTGGAARTLARVLQRRSPLYPMSRVHQYEIRRADLEVLVDDLGRMTVAEKQRVPGLREDRADILYAGAAAILAVARRLRVESLTVCGQGLREACFTGSSAAAARPQSASCAAARRYSSAPDWACPRRRQARSKKQPCACTSCWSLRSTWRGARSCRRPPSSRTSAAPSATASVTATPST
jgi:exopolyphosphatase/guanosine-5'-triphosphate,3'-diphosphate pyrophosphatase